MPRESTPQDLARRARAYVSGFDRAAERFPLTPEAAESWRHTRELLLGLVGAIDSMLDAT